MGIVFRQSVKTTIVIFTGAILGAAFIYISAFVFRKDFSGLGFVRTTINISAIFQYMILLGAGPTIQTYAARYAPGDNRRKVLLTLGCITPLATMIVLLMPYLLLRGQLVHIFQPEDQVYFNRYFLWLPFMVISWAYMTLFESYLISQNKTALGTFMREVLLRICNLLTLAAFYFGYISFHVFVILFLLSYFLPAGISFFFSARTSGFGLSMQWNIFSKKEYRELIHFSWYHLLMGISFYFVGFLDSLMLAALDPKGVASVPVYSVAVFIVTVMTIPYRAMANAAYPVLNQAYTDNDMPKLRDLFSRSGINIQIVAVAMALVIGLNLSNAAALLPQGYEHIGILVLVLMIGRITDMATGLNNEVISISSLYKFNFRISLLLLVMVIILNRIFIPMYGAVGAAIGTSSALAIFNLCKLLFLRHKMRLLPFSNKSLVVLLAGILIGGVVYIIPAIGGPITDAIIRTAIIIVLYTVLLIRLRPSPDLNTYLASIRKNKRLF